RLDRALREAGIAAQIPTDGKHRRGIISLTPTDGSIVDERIFDRSKLRRLRAIPLLIEEGTIVGKGQLGSSGWLSRARFRAGRRWRRSSFHRCARGSSPGGNCVCGLRPAIGRESGFGLGTCRLPHRPKETAKRQFGKHTPISELSVADASIWRRIAEAIPLS